jgi:hypothetical protein
METTFYQVIELDDNYTQTFVRALRSNVNDKTQFVVVVAPSPKQDLYDSVKKFCTCEKGGALYIVNPLRCYDFVCQQSLHKSSWRAPRVRSRC